MKERVRPADGEAVKGAVLIAGPTATGKSALALDLAERLDGVVINADSMQVYAVLRILTARPGPDELERAPHALYGHVHPSRSYSTGSWLRDVAHLLLPPGLEGRRPIFVGGTGLYFRALVEGLSEMPDIPDDVRSKWRAELAGAGAQKLHALLAERDAEAAASIRPTDGQRIVRALEVLDASGVSIRKWQARKGRPLVDLASATALVIEPPRDLLRERIANRLRDMLAAGALEEAQAIRSLGLDPRLPAMRAIGVPQLIDVLEGRSTLQEAELAIAQATGQYAKRQATWFRHQFDERWLRLSAVPDSLNDIGAFFG